MNNPKPGNKPMNNNGVVCNGTINHEFEDQLRQQEIVNKPGENDDINEICER
jgi:hypothetical protein